MKEYQRQFIELAISKEVIQFGDFTLKSGRKSPYFFNSGLFHSGADLALVGHCYAAALMDADIPFDQLFGPAYKGIPLVITTAIALAQHYQHNVPYCFNRQERKAHGEGGCLVGRSPTGRLVLIDDVITAGTAIHQSMPLLTAGGATLAGIVLALDRQERGSDVSSTPSALQALAQQYSCRIISIITLTDLISYFSAQPSLAGSLRLIRDYQQRYGYGILI